MIYEKLAGEFGCVDGELTLQPGLNVVYAPNETGKSTWCALIRATMYGVDTRERVSTGVLPTKTKYVPWSGRPAFGRITVKKDGRSILLTRQTHRGKMFSAFSAVYADTNEPVAALDAQTAGETLTGVTADVFTRSLFCTGEQMAVSENADLEKKIAAIAGTGDDEISASEAIKQLNSWKNERRHNKTGRLPQLEREIAAGSAELAEIESLNREIWELDSALKEARSEAEALEADRAAFAAIDTTQDDARAAADEEVAKRAAERAIAFRTEHGLSGGRGDYATCITAAEQFRTAAGREAECRVAEAEYYRAESGMRALAVCPAHLRKFDGLTADFAHNEAAADCRRAIELLGAKPKLWLFLAALLMLAAGIALYQPTYQESLAGSTFLFLGGLGAIIATGLGIASILRAKKARKEGAALCASYGAEHPDAITVLATEYTQFLHAAHQARAESEKAADKLDLLQKKHAQALTQAENAAAALRIPFNAESAAAAEALARLNRQLEDLCAEADRTAQLAAERKAAQAAEAAARKAAVAAKTRTGSQEATLAALETVGARIRTLEQTRAERMGRLSHFSDFAYLSAEIAQKQAEHARLSAEYSAIELAMNWIAESADELARRLTPRLCSRASELFAEMTGGKYGEVLIDKRFAAEVIAAGEELPRSMLSLSRGALDQLYLAMRIALSELFFTDDLPPLILDDCFAAFDDERSEQTLALLARLAADRQIILFTCRGRECEAADRLGAHCAVLA